MFLFISNATLFVYFQTITNSINLTAVMIKNFIYSHVSTIFINDYHVYVCELQVITNSKIELNFISVYICIMYIAYLYKLIFN